MAQTRRQAALAASHAASPSAKRAKTEPATATSKPSAATAKSSATKVTPKATAKASTKAAPAAKPKATPAKSAKNIEVGDNLPDIEVTLQNEEKLNLSERFAKGVLVLFAYPKASTPGCTRQTSGFGAAFNEFKKLGATVFGLSADSPKAQTTFKEKTGVDFDLISDPSYALLGPLGAKKNPRGVIRSHWVFVDGKAVLVEHSVKPDDSPEITLAKVRSLDRDATEEPTEEADTKEADAEEANGTEADAKEAGAKEADTKEADTKEANGTEADAKEADAKEPDAKEANGTEADKTLIEPLESEPKNVPEATKTESEATKTEA